MTRPGGAFWRFCAVGVVGLVVDVGVLYLLAPWLDWYVARVVSFMAAVTTTWALNRRYTFTDRAVSRSPWQEYAGYVLSMLGGAALNYGTFVFVLLWSVSLPDDSGPSTARRALAPFIPALGVAAGSVVGLVANYLAARHLVYARRRLP